MRGRPVRCNGFALVAVLWLLALLTALATAAAVVSVSHRRAAQRLAESVEADALCDSALRVELLRLLAPRAPGDQVLIGVPFPVTVPAGTVRVSVERDSGKIDLNTAPGALIYALFASNGWHEAAAHSLAARITEWRATEPANPGAEQERYAAAGLHYAPRNAPFRSTAELRQVQGAQAIAAPLLDAFTVYTHADLPVESAASPAVLSALQYADAQQLDGHHWLTPNPAGQLESRMPLPTAASGVTASSLAGEVLTMIACQEHANFTRCRRAVVRLTGNTRNPLEIFEWRTLLLPDR